MSIPVYILKRILVSIPTIVIVSMIGFFLMRYDVTIGPLKLGDVQVIEQHRFKNPIDPLGALRTNPQITQEALQQEERRLGLDKPMHVQYWLWVTNLLDFNPSALLKGNPGGFFTPDLGRTFSGESVWDVILSRAKNTLLLNVIVITLSWLIAIPLGVYAALRWRSLSDRLMTVLASVGMSLPSFVLALVAAVFAVKTGLFPLGGITSVDYETFSPPRQVLDVAYHLILPVLVLTVGGLASIQRQMRGNLLDVLKNEYIRTARAKGLPENVVIYKHAVRTAVNPLVTMMGFEFAGLLSGSLLVEMVLNYPGLGNLAYRAALETDTNLMMSILVMSAVMLVLGNLFADILLKLVDPRITLD